MNNDNELVEFYKFLSERAIIDDCCRGEGEAECAVKLYNKSKVKNLDIQRVKPRFSEITAESDDKAFSWILKDKRNADHPENNSDMIRRLVHKYNDLVEFLNGA